MTNQAQVKRREGSSVNPMSHSLPLPLPLFFLNKSYPSQKKTQFQLQLAAPRLKRGSTVPTASARGNRELKKMTNKHGVRGTLLSV